MWGGAVPVCTGISVGQVYAGLKMVQCGAILKFVDLKKSHHTAPLPPLYTVEEHKIKME